MAGILFVGAGADAERAVFRDQARGLWSAALPVVLEKHGFLSFDEVGPDALADAELLARYDVVLVARGADDPWTDEALSVLRDRDIPLVIDGPPSATVRAALGLDAPGHLTGPGRVTIREPGLRAAVARYGPSVGGIVAMPEDLPPEHPPSLHWSMLGSVPLTREQAIAWSAQPWDAEAWPSAAGGTVLMDWLSGDAGVRTPAVVRWQRVVACSFGLFSFLAYSHTAAPTAPDARQMTDRSLGLEAALLAIIDVLHRDRGAVRARVRLWPAGVPWVLAVRHDIPRGGAEQVREAITADPTPGTWACTANRTEEVAQAAGSAGHEVALLARRLWADTPDPDELAIASAAHGQPIRGVVTSRTSDAFCFQGAPNVLWAETERLLYTELLGRAHMHPHRFPSLGADGRIDTLDVVCLPHYENLDSVTATREQLTAVVRLWSATAGLLQLRADPAAHVPERLARVRDADLLGAGRWTLLDAASWWKHSHDRRNLSLTALGDGRFALRAAAPIKRLAIELLHPDGSVTEHVVDAGADEVIVAAEVRRLVFPTLWEETFSAYQRALTDTAHGTAGLTGHAGTRAAATAPSVALAGERALRLMEEFGGRGDVTGSVVLEISGDDGASAYYVAWRARPEAVIGVRRDAGVARAAQEATDSLGIDQRMRFVRGEPSDLGELPDNSVDVVVADHGLVAPSLRLRRQTASELGRVVVPGGTIVVRQANRRRMLALELGWRLRRSGWAEVRTVGYATGRRHLNGLRKYLDPSFSIVARRRGSRVPRAKIDVAASAPGKAPQIRFPEEVPAVFAHHLRRHLRQFGVDGDTAARIIRANSTLAERRARQLLDVLRDTTGIRTLEAKVVLEIGCGFGAVAAQLAILDPPSQILAVDTDERKLEVARACFEELELSPPLGARRLGMRALNGVADESIDVVLANTSFRDLGTARDAGHALDEIARVLAPGAGVLLYHVDRRPAGGTALLRRRLRRAGLEPVATRAFSPRAVRLPLPRAPAGGYAVAARKPGSDRGT